MPLERYKSWVRSHSGLVTAIEGALQSAVWLLPERFSDSELKCEALNSALGLISLYHASIIDGESTRAGKEPRSRDPPRDAAPSLLSPLQGSAKRCGPGPWLRGNRP